jgi:exoribonuclease R
MAKAEFDPKHPPFPLAVDLESRVVALKAARNQDIFEGRKVVKGFTIDDRDTQDMDDAIWVEKRGKGYELSVSISDVAAFVPPRSRIDRHAQHRGFTVYYKDDTSSPMLPSRLSNGLFSLRPKERRATITITTLFDEHLQQEESTIELTQLRSNNKLSYEAANGILADRGHNLHEAMSMYADIAAGLKVKRKQKGDLVLPDWINRKGRSASIIEECMLYYNGELTSYLMQNEMLGLNRNQESLLTNEERRVLQAKIDASSADDDPKEVRKLVERVHGRASWSPDNKGHHSLQMDRYMQGSSPIRRYPDVINQFGVYAVRHGEEHPYSHEELIWISEHINSLPRAKRLIPDQPQRGDVFVSIQK